MTITKDQISTINSPMKYSDDKLVSIMNALNQTFQRYSINTPLRIAHFLAQVLHESGAFHYSTEIWGNSAAQQRYDTRIDLGNTPEHDGDGYKYRGEGWIQLTGKNNFRALSKEFGVDFVSNPELVGKEPYDSLSAGWYWKTRDLNKYADLNDLLTITKKVNGGLNGLNSRKMWFSKAYKVLGE